MIKFIQERQGGAERSGDILLNAAIPADGSIHPDYAGFYAYSVSSPQKVGGGESDGSFVVTVQYSASSQAVPQGIPALDQPPWKQKAYNVSFPGGKDIVVPMIKAYKEGDTQFNPTDPVIHPATKEVLIAETVESHGILSFSYAVKKWDYNWQQLYRNTSNSKAITILGYNFKPNVLLITKLGATLKNYTDVSGKVTNYWEISVEIEDFGREIKKELALQGYLCIDSAKVRNIQLKDGAYGFFDEKRPDLNISAPRWVNTSGVVLAANATPGNTHYKTFYDTFRRDWSVLGLPSEAV